jgi:hypothetical protein
MKLSKQCGLSVALLAGLVGGARGQVAAPAAAVPAVPVAAAPVAAAPAAAAPAAAPSNLWTFLCPSPEQKAACKAKFCASTFGQLISNSMLPLGAFTGGVIPNCCPQFPAADLAKPPDSAEGAAARVQQDTAAAKARRAAVRYLGTVDCNYWPEAQDALINSLRADRNECVRLEAALALSRGCCCTVATLKALILTVTSRRDDGNPAECSPRVKAAAAVALQHCLGCYTEVVPAPPVKPVVPVVPVKPAPADLLPPPRPEPKPETSARSRKDRATAPAAEPAGYYERLRQASMPQLLQEARSALRQMQVPIAPVAASASAAGTRAPISVESPSFGHNGLLELLAVTLPAPPTAKPVASSAVKPAPPASPSPPLASPPVPVPPPARASQPEVPAAVIRPVTYRAPTPAPAPPLAPAIPIRRDPRPPAMALAPACAPSQPPAMGAPAPPPEQPSLELLLSVLRNSVNQVEREQIVNILAAPTPRPDPCVVRALLQSARSDSAPLVRAASLRALVTLRVTDAVLLDLAARAQAERDPRIREAGQELAAWLRTLPVPLTTTVATGAPRPQ